MRRHLAALGAATILAGSLAACSSDGGTEADVESDPGAALQEAVSALGDFTGVELTMTIDGDASALAEDIGDEDDAQLLLDSALVLRARGESEADAQVQFVVDLGGTEVADIRFLPEQQLFFRVDLDAIGEVVDDPNFEQGLDEAVSGAEMFGAGDLATAVVNGDWVQLTGLEQFIEMAGNMAGVEQEEPSEEEVEDLQQQIVGALEDFLDEDVQVEYVGSEDAGERVRATTDGAALQELTEEITAIASEAGGVDTPPIENGEIPADEEITVDAWIADGRLTQIGFDLGSVEDGAPEGTSLLIAIDDFDGDVEAPEAATEFDLFGLLGSAMGGMGGDLGEMPTDDGATDDGAVDDSSVDDGAAEDGAAEDGAGDPLGGECLTQEQLDDLVAQGAGTEEELQQAIDAGVLQVC